MGAWWLRCKHLLWIFLAIGTSTIALAASKDSDLAAPSIDLEAIAETTAIARSDSTIVAVILSNKSNLALTNVRVRSLDPMLTGSAKLGVIGSFSSAQTLLTLRADKWAPFGDRHVPLLVTYDWSSENREFESGQALSTTITIQRPFEDEAKGLPGGSGALLYILLPVMPAFLAFEFVNGWRTGKGFKMPTFSSDYVLPAFLIGLAISFLVVLSAKQKLAFAYENPVSFISMLGVSLGVGALLAFLPWGWAVLIFQMKGLKEGEKTVPYVEKAFRLSKRGVLSWCTGKANNERWEGLLLKQPNGTYALGARVQLSPKQGSLQAKELRSAFNSSGEVIDWHKLKKWLKSGCVNIDYQQRIRRGNNDLNQFVAVDELNGFQIQEEKRECLFAVVD